jgi:hypothetical protein
VRQLKNVHIADGATIVGPRDIQVRVRQSRFAQPEILLKDWLGSNSAQSIPMQ